MLHQENREENNNENNTANIKSDNDIKKDDNNDINKNISEKENNEDNQKNKEEDNQENKSEEEIQKNQNMEDAQKNIKKEEVQENKKINVEQEEKMIEKEKLEKNEENNEINEIKIKEILNEINQNQNEKNKIKQEEKLEEKENKKKEEENKIKQEENIEKEENILKEEQKNIKEENINEEENQIKKEENKRNEEENKVNEEENNIKEEENNIKEEKNNKTNEEENKINEKENKINEEENNIKEEDNNIKEEKENKINEEENKINEKENNKIIEDNKIKEEQNISEEKNSEVKNEDKSLLNSKEEIITKIEINIKNDKNDERDIDKEKENQNNKIEIKEDSNKEINNNQIIIENKKEEEKEKNEIIIKEENSKEHENTNNIIIETNNNPLQEIPEDIRKVKLKEPKEDQNKYLVNPEEDKEYKKIISEQMKDNNDLDDSDEEEEETFPFRFVGDVQKKGDILGFFNERYLEIDSVKGLIKRYASSKEYPSNPLEIIPIKNLKTLKKVKKSPKQDYYEFNLSYIPENKTKEKTHIYRVKHIECRTKWFDSILILFKHIVKGEPLPPINKNKLIFIDDQVGISQEIKQNSNKRKKQITSHSVFLRNFKILAELGVGAFGTVFKVQHILTEKIYAMKVMNKNYIIHKKYLSYVVSEFEILKTLTGFPFVIGLHYCFQSANYLFMVIDICPGGDFDNLKYINNLKLFFAELVLAFEHIHKHHVVYRDLKPENILLDPYGHIKVCDFNLAKGGISKQKRATSFCGSPMYLSPEMLEPEGVDQRADIYGIGLILYELVTDKPAFMAQNLDELYNKIKNNRIDFNDPKLKGDLKDLLQKILVANPDDRYSIDEIKKHPYFNDIDFAKVLKREYGPIIIEKKDPNQINIKLRNQNFTKNILKNNDKEKDDKVNEEKKGENDFKEKQKKLDEDKDFSFLDGKISVREMKKDQKRAMKNYVREFYYIKHEDQPQTEEFHLVVNGYIDLDEI